MKPLEAADGIRASARMQGNQQFAAAPVVALCDPDSVSQFPEQGSPTLSRDPIAVVEVQRRGSYELNIHGAN